MLDINEFIEIYYGDLDIEYGLIDELVTLEEFENWKEKKEIEEWDYPLEEYEHITELHKELGTEFEAVRFAELYGGYEYRFCEVPNDID